VTDDPVDTALGHQEMQVRVEVDPLPEGLDGDNDAGDDGLTRQSFKIEPEGPDSRPAELPEKLSPG